MALSLARARQMGQKQTTAKKLAAEYESQQEKAQKRSGWSSILGGVGGKLLGGALTAALAPTGIGIPLVLAASNMLAKKGAHELTGAMGMGADASGLKADEYGYGADEADTLKGALKSQMAVDPMDEHGFIGKELLSAGLSTGLEGKLGKPLQSLLEGKVPSFAKAKDVMSPLHDPEGYTGLFFEQAQEFGPQLPMAGGGQVPQMDQLLELIELSESMNKGAYAGTPLEESQPTIADYFASQGKTLGGNNTQSLSQKLGR